jgi:hypothetical protein
MNTFSPFAAEARFARAGALSCAPLWRTQHEKRAHRSAFFTLACLSAAA